VAGIKVPAAGAGADVEAGLGVTVAGGAGMTGELLAGGAMGLRWLGLGGGGSELHAAKLRVITRLIMRLLWPSEGRPCDSLGPKRLSSM